MKFLVVDDDPIILSLLTEILIGFGFEDVERARSGQEALSVIASSKTAFECIMLDIQMPGMDGIELCRAIRRAPQYTTIPIIMITVMRDSDHVMRAFEAGATDYTVKPFEIRDLIERIRIAEIVKDPDQARQLALSRAQSHRQTHTVNNLISRAALESYVRNCRTHKLISPVALAVRISPFDSFSVSDVARVMVGVFEGKGVFLSYLGDGEFVMVCDRYAKIGEDRMKERLTDLLAGIPGGRSDLNVHAGTWAGPRRFENSGDIAFLNRAIFNCRKEWWDASRPGDPILEKLRNAF